MQGLTMATFVHLLDVQRNPVKIVETQLKVDGWKSKWKSHDRSALWMATDSGLSLTNDVRVDCSEFVKAALLILLKKCSESPIVLFLLITFKTSYFVVYPCERLKNVKYMARVLWQSHGFNESAEAIRRLKTTHAYLVQSRHSVNCTFQFLE